MFRTFSFAMLALGIALLGGCASPSQITLTDGRQMQSLDTPEYDEDTASMNSSRPTAGASA